jgi:hypothetical protein
MTPNKRDGHVALNFKTRDGSAVCSEPVPNLLAIRKAEVQLPPLTLAAFSC